MMNYNNNINNVPQCYGLVQNLHLGYWHYVHEVQQLQDEVIEFCAPLHIVYIELLRLLQPLDSTGSRWVSSWCVLVARSVSTVVAHCQQQFLHNELKWVWSTASELTGPFPGDGVDARVLCYVLHQDMMSMFLHYCAIVL